MRQALAKATRRDLRRAVGVSAIGTIQQIERASNGLRADVVAIARDHAFLKADTRESYETLKRQSDALTAKVDFLWAEHDTLIALLQWYQRGFWGRLRWLCRGWR